MRAFSLAFLILKILKLENSLTVLKEGGILLRDSSYSTGILLLFSYFITASKKEIHA